MRTGQRANSAKRIKMIDVARLAGVSVATVSRALTSAGPVSAQARRRIEKALAATGYKINSVARSLRRMESRAVIVVVPDVGQPYFSLILRGIEEYAVGIGYSVLIGNSDHDPEREGLYAQDVMTGRADGLILINGSRPLFGSARMSSLPPIVAVSDKIAGADLPMVGIDDTAAAEKAVRHLLDLGHRRIGHIGGAKRNTMTGERCSGYRKAMRRFGLPARPDWIVYGDYSIESGAEAARRLFGLHPSLTAIFAGNDDMAIGAMNEAKARGLRIPEDLSVVGFDDVPFAANYDPALTTIRQPFVEMGSFAMETLSRLLEGDESRKKSVQFPTELIVRNSTKAIGSD